MFGFARRRAVAMGLAVAATVASAGAAQALLDDGANFSVAIPVTAVVPIGVCSAQSVATSNNVNRGGEFERNDAKSRSESESRCDVANNILRNVEDVLNDNNNGNLVGNLSHNNNDSGNHNLNNNIRDLFNGSAVTL
jgi:hypothetical protein